MKDIQIISDLREALALADEKTWDLVERLDASLNLDPHHSDYERSLVRRIRMAVTDDLLTRRDGIEPDTSNARVALGALETSLKKRTVGTDGWRLA
jgi:hypothetical protein